MVNLIRKLYLFISFLFYFIPADWVHCIDVVIDRHWDQTMLLDYLDHIRDVNSHHQDLRTSWELARLKSNSKVNNHDNLLMILTSNDAYHQIIYRCFLIQHNFHRQKFCSSEPFVKSNLPGSIGQTMNGHSEKR